MKITCVGLILGLLFTLVGCAEAPRPPQVAEASPKQQARITYPKLPKAKPMPPWEVN